MQRKVLASKCTSMLFTCLGSEYTKWPETPSDFVPNAVIDWPI